MNERLPKFKGEELLGKIEKSTDGLTYISETDAAIEPVYISSEKAEKFLASLGKDEKNETLDPAPFFDRLTIRKEWFGPKESDRAKKFTALEEILRNNLRDLKLIRTGRVRIDIYVVGLDTDRNLIGIKTKAVET